MIADENIDLALPVQRLAEGFEGVESESGIPTFCAHNNFARVV